MLSGETTLNLRSQNCDHFAVDGREGATGRVDGLNHAHNAAISVFYRCTQNGTRFVTCRPIMARIKPRIRVSVGDVNGLPSGGHRARNTLITSQTLDSSVILHRGKQ
jgi:hypothetical protein